MENNHNIFDEDPIRETQPTENDSASNEPAETQYEVIDDIPKSEPISEAYYTPPIPVYTDFDEPEKAKRKMPLKPMKVWAIVLVTALVTSVLTSGILYGVYRYTSAGIDEDDSVIIYRDGNDLRTKVDLMTALGLDSAEDGTPLSVTAVANRVGPTVVGIAAQGTVDTNSIFGVVQQPFSSSGTGFIISTDGYIVTNNHVITGASKVVVTLENDKEYDAVIIGTDEKTDLAVLKIEETGLTPAVLGSSSDVQVGELAVAIGNPLGQTFSGTVTTGIISATNRKVTLEGQEYTLLQTDAAINSGNSGGPLANAYGEIIGINNAKIASSGVEGLGFAIPVDIAKPVIEDLIEVGYVRGRPLIGINGRNITEEISEYYNLPIGIYVVSVEEFSAAENAGIKIGDVITECNGQVVKTVDELNEIRDAHKSGDELRLKIVRGERTMEVTIVLGEDRPSVSLN